MKMILKIFLLAPFILGSVRSWGQEAPATDKPKKAAEVKTVTPEPAADDGNAAQDKVTEKKDQKKEDKKGEVKQIKSDRPDMSRSRGARPPDIVRPSGSRVPKGVGRPAGAGRHGRR